MLHLRAGRAGISRDAYPDMDEFWDDAAAAYRAAIAAFAKAGCTYLQLDDVAFAYLCDPKIRDTCRKNGDDPDALPAHLRRDHQRARWRTARRHDDHDAHLPRQLQERLGRRGRLRAGGRGDVLQRRRRLLHGVRQRARRRLRAAALRAARARKWCSAWCPPRPASSGDKDDLKRRIDEAAKYVPLEDLCLSPQCGFSSTHHGNLLTEDEQWRKLERVVEVAARGMALDAFHRAPRGRPAPHRPGPLHRGLELSRSSSTAYFLRSDRAHARQ